MARNVPYYYAPTAPMAAPAVMTMPMRQIYVVPRTVVPPTPAPYTSFWPHFPAQPVNVPLARPVAPQLTPVAQPLAPGPPKMEHAHAPMVQWTTQPVVSAPRTLPAGPPKMECIYASRVQTATKTVVSAPRSFVPGPPTKDPVHTSMVQATTKTFASAPRPAACAGLVGPNLEVPLQKGVEKISAEEVHKLLEAGLCLLIDVRGDDRASGHIEGSVHEPTSFQAPLLNRVPELVAKFSKEKLVIFHCQYSLHRGPQCANWYREQAPPTQRVAVLEGGFRGWEGQRLSVVREKAMDAHGQAKADLYALSMGRRVAGAGA